MKNHEYPRISVPNIKHSIKTVYKATISAIIPDNNIATGEVICANVHRTT